MIQLPLIVSADDGLIFFTSVTRAQGYLEPIDVANNEYVAYDGDGRLVELNVERTVHRFLLFGRIAQERTIVGPGEEDPTHVHELRSALFRHLHSNGVRLTDPDIPTRELIERAMDCGDVYN